MKKLLLPLLILTTVLSVKAESKNFTVASLNVDGMPKTIKVASLMTIDLNKDAKETEGAIAIGKKIASQSWDIVSLSEDFNYHSDLMTQVNQYYFAGTWRGKLEDVPLKDVGGFLNGSKHFDTDGLGLLYNKSLNVSNESMHSWNTTYGITSDGSDQLIDKGYRYYVVNIAPGLEVDVYIHHMDAEIGEKDIAARESQLTQIVEAILNSNNKRPIIIMGDTNCRYTRDNLKELLFKKINDDPRFEIHDPWVEYMWNEEGGYEAPQLQLGQPAIMTSNPLYGHNKGEVVDKIFYINNVDANGVILKANSYRSAIDFTFDNGEPLSDHFPVVVEFTITNPNEGVKPGVEYYIRNEATGLYINQGADYGTSAIVSDYGNRISLERNGDDFYMKTTAGYMKPELYLDGSDTDKGTFSFKDSGNGYYNILINGKALTTPISGTKVILSELSDDDDYQKWNLLTIENLKDELKSASDTNPMDATFFMKGAGINRNDGDNSKWLLEPRTNSSTSIGGDESNWNIDLYNKSVALDSKTQYNLTYESTGLPSGKYKLSYYGLTTATFERCHINETIPLDIPQYTDTPNSDVNIRHSVAKNLFEGGQYYKEIDNIIITNGTLKIDLYKNKSDESWTCLDNFRLTYYGPTDEMLVAKNKVKEALDDVANKLKEIEPDARATYNNNLVEQAYAQNRISNTGYDEVQKTYEALATATKKQVLPGANMTYAINNWSFEMGWMTNIDRFLPYWITEWTGDNTARPISDATYYVDNAHLNYILNNWANNSEAGGDGWGCKSTYQVINGLPNGIYRIDALVSGGQLFENDVNHYIHIFGNDTYSKPILSNSKTHFEEASVEVKVTDGTLKIGVVGADKAGNIRPEEAVGSWYKADNFRLTYLSSLGFETVQKAINDAYSKAEKTNVIIDLQKYQSAVDNKTIVGDGTVEITEIFSILAEETKKQIKPGSDITYAIINNSFEYPEYGLYELTGWNTTLSGDTKVVEANNDANINNYGVTGIDGKYVFNTWIDGSTGFPLYQTLYGMPQGKYELKALVASDNGNTYHLTACGITGNNIVTTNKGTFVEASLIFDYIDNTVPMEIGIITDNWWYKADNFRLTYISPLEQTITWTMEGSKYDTLILPFGVESKDMPENLSFHSANNFDDNNGTDTYHVLALGSVETSLQAYTPYIVMRAVNAYSTRSVEAIDENTYKFTGIPEENNNTEYTNGLLTGVLTDTDVEEGHYVVSHNNENSVFTNKGGAVKAYHAYIRNDNSANPTSPSIYFEAPENIGTGVENIAAEESLVDVFTTTGIKIRKNVTAAKALEGLDPGIYILSDGSRIRKTSK